MQFDLVKSWYSRYRHPLLFLLIPFSWLFALLAACRRILYRIGIFKTHRFAVPVIIVGNITVGGTGKTPFVIWLAKLLKEKGYRPGIVSRGVGGQRHLVPYEVTEADLPAEVGDEAILFARRAACPVVIGIHRAAVVQHLLEHHNCNIVISDDGLQHYRLGRDMEIVIVDGARRFGNRRLLPAGPLREPLSRLKKVDFMVVNGGDVRDEYTMSLEQSGLVSLKDPDQKKNLAEFYNQEVHAVAGIGHPKRFFRTLRQSGLKVIPHAFPDHYAYRSKDIKFNDDLPVMMTEKDAVKCEGFSTGREWYLAVDVKVDAKLEEAILGMMRRQGSPQYFHRVD